MVDLDATYKDPENPKWIGELLELHPKDIAEHLEDLGVDTIRLTLRKLPDELTADVMSEFDEELQVGLFEIMRLDRVSDIVTEMYSDDAADVLGQISGERRDEIMATLEPEDARDISDLMRYPEDTAGGIMQTEFIAVSENNTLQEAIDMLRAGEEEAGQGANYIYVVDDKRSLNGVVRIRDLIFREPSLRIRDVMNPEVRAVSIKADQEEIGNVFRDYGYTALPVVDDFRHLIGVVTIDDVLHIMEEEATEDMQKMVGLTGEESVDTSWRKSVRTRLPWLYLNLGTAFLAGSVIAMFEKDIGALPVLAVFLPIIAMVSGNAGAQTLTIIVRSLALGEVKQSRQKHILFKEMTVGLLNGLAIGIAVGIVSWIWKGHIVLGVVAFLAMTLTMLLAVTAGVLIPLTLKALKIDPALASNIMLTTTADVAGFLLFLGLAAIGLHYFPIF